MKKSLYYIRITAVLLLISSLIALMLAFVNKLTLDKIDENIADARNAAIVEIFPTMSVTEAVEMELPDGVNGVYCVIDGAGVAVGYCADISSYGYGSDPINLLVGLDGREVVDVRIVSHSETPGLGSKATLPAFLGQFFGKSGSLAVKKDGGDIDAVAGATVSSRAITAGVSLALSLDIPTD